MSANYHGYDMNARSHGNCWFTATADRLNFAGVEVSPKVFDGNESVMRHMDSFMQKQIEYSEKFERLTATTFMEFCALRLQRKNFSVIAWNGTESSHIFVVDSVAYLNEGYYNRFETPISDERVAKLVIQDMDKYIEELKTSNGEKRMYDKIILIAAKRYVELHPEYDLDTVLRIGLSSYIIPNDAGICESELDFVEEITHE